VVSESEAAERLIAICPGFQPRWKEHLEFDEGKRYGGYVDLAVLAEWVIDEMIKSDHTCLPVLFTEVEALLTDASTAVRSVVVIGLLEEIHHWLAGSYGGKGSRVDPDLVTPFFGSMTKTEWNWLISTFGPVTKRGNGATERS
jgi:hypothetical protein